MLSSHAHAVRQFPTVRQHMTPAPHTIGRGCSLAKANRTMKEHGVRHLPVLEGGKIIGLVTDRDVLLVESLPGVNPTDVTVEDAMVVDVFAVPPDAPVGEVVETMIDRKLGSAVVTEGDHVVGVFTTIDALRTLRAMLAPAD
ncbi:MAG TPA: CBS domain-containing protein [Polyangia bacterium]|nr:CBS domain-containing protein [Polyangia bacterium]